jgi:hypothetical protein
VALENHSPFDLQYKRKTRDTVKIITCNFKEQLLDLLSNKKLFGSLDNPVINGKEPFAPYDSPVGQFAEVHDGQWYFLTQINAKLGKYDFFNSHDFLYQ